jgi:hypothetical protein
VTNDVSTLIFLHIPKTAGTTFNSILSWQYRRQPSVWVPAADTTADSIHSLSVSERESLRLVRGHVHFGLHASFQHPCTYATVLRLPVPRVISYYLNQRREAEKRPDSDAWWCRAVRTLSLREFILSGQDPELENGQVRRIAGIANRAAPCTRDDLDLAIANLERHFTVVGLTERFDETASLAARRLHWNRPVVYRPEKVAPPSPERQRIAEDPATLEAIREANQWDAKLYDYVVQRFQQQVAQAGFWFPAQVYQIHLRNRCLGPLIPFARKWLRRSNPPAKVVQDA